MKKTQFYDIIYSNYWMENNMETNNLLTDKIELSGGGLIKSYEESMIIHSCNYKFGHAYKNHIFMNTKGGITWADTIDKTIDEAQTEYEKMLQNPNLKRVIVLKIYPTDNGRAWLEIIDPAILKAHLIQEANQKRELMDKLTFIAEKLGYSEDQNKLTL